MNTTSKIFTCKIIEQAAYIFACCGCPAAAAPATATTSPTCPTHHHPGHTLNCKFCTKSHFNHEMIYFPSVTEIEVYFIADQCYTNFVNEFTKFGSCPNLSKLTIIGENKGGVVLDVNDMLEKSVNKKLKHIILKGMSPNIDPSTLDKAKLFIQVQRIRLDIV